MRIKHRSLYTYKDRGRGNRLRRKKWANREPEWIGYVEIISTEQLIERYGYQ